eukprot:SAG11_NODE_36560_length_261_cov_0.604938_1_plen_75_part_10
MPHRKHGLKPKHRAIQAAVSDEAYTARICRKVATDLTAALRSFTNERRRFRSCGSHLRVGRVRKIYAEERHLLCI